MPRGGESPPRGVTAAMVFESIVGKPITVDLSLDHF